MDVRKPTTQLSTGAIRHCCHDVGGCGQPLKLTVANTGLQRTPNLLLAFQIART